MDRVRSAVARVARRPLRALVSPIMRRLHPRVVEWVNELTGPRLGAAEQAIGALRGDVEGMERYVPALLGAIASANRSIRRDQRDDIELARLLTEVLSAGVGHGVGADHRGLGSLETSVAAKILRPERLAAATQTRLSIGAEPADASYLCVDSIEGPRTDIVADPAALPFDPGTVSEIRAPHVLERFSMAEVREVLLPHWVALLQDSGILAVVVCDMDKLARDYVSGAIGLDELQLGGLGAEHLGLGPRRSAFSAASIVDLLRRSGLEELSVTADPLRGDLAIEVSGSKVDGGH
ncbi:MAG: hypothetical protein ACRDVP_01570 [Acidimicrobiales bacterium]